MRHPKTLKPLRQFSKPQLSLFIVVFALVGYLIFRAFAAPNPNLPGDLNNDNTVNITDLSILLSNYGTSNSSADINGDGTVNVLDLSILLSHYGQSISLTASPDNTVVNGTNGQIVDANGHIWTITSGGQVAVDGVVDPITNSVLTLAYESGKVWQKNSANLWWYKILPSDTWLPTGGTTTSPIPGGGSTSTKLKWTPPGYNPSCGNPSSSACFPGYKVVDAPQGPGTPLNLDDNTDYYIRLGHPQWSSTSGSASELDINGGRNRVIIGGQITTTSTNATDDIRDLIIDGGNPAGITHIEGVLFDKSVNGITLRTPQTVQIENVRMSQNYVYEDDADTAGVHPDLIQVWDGGAPNIRVDHFSGYTDFTGFSVLLAPNPQTWQAYNVDLHDLPPQPNSVSSGVPLTGGNFAYLGDQKVTQWAGSSFWIETGYYNASWRRKLDDVINYGASCATYELHPGPSQTGSVFTSANPCSGGSGTSSDPVDLGRRQGDTMTFSRVPLLSGLILTWGIAPTSAGADANGNFVPAAVPGLNYISPGYQ